MSVKGCNCCGKEVDIHGGGCALMIAFCVNHTTTLTNISFCKECYEALVKPDLARLNTNANLNLCLGEE